MSKHEKTLRLLDAILMVAVGCSLLWTLYVGWPVFSLVWRLMWN